MRKDRESRANLRLANHPKHLALVGRHLLGAADFAERAPSPGRRVPNEAVDQLILRLRRNLRGIHDLQVVTAARHDVYAGALRDFPKVLVVRAHIGVTAVDNTSHAFFSRGPHLVDHEVGIFEIRRRRRSGRSRHVGRAHSFEEAAAEGEVFVEKDGWHLEGSV